MFQAGPSFGSNDVEKKTFRRDAAWIPSGQNTPVQLRDVLDGDVLAGVLDPDHHMLLSDAELASVFRSTELPGKIGDSVLQHDAKEDCQFSVSMSEAKLIRFDLNARCDCGLFSHLQEESFETPCC